MPKHTIRTEENLAPEELLDVLNDSEDLTRSIISNLRFVDSRATYTEESLCLEDVLAQDDNYYSCSYIYGWEAYHGCKDKIGGDINSGEFYFEYKGDSIEIQIEEHEERDTSYEL